MVKRSGMLMVLGWDLQSSFIIDQVKRLSNLMFHSKVQIGDKRRGYRFYLERKTLAIWSITPTTHKP